MFHVEHNTTKPQLLCPVCGHDNYVSYLKLKDYFLSEEEFSIIKCTNCGLLITYPQPNLEDLSRYYVSKQYLSHATQNKGIEYFLFNQVRNITLANKVDLIRKYSNGNTLLDIGCATGVFLNYCRGHNFDVQGIEPNKKARTYAIENYGLNVNDVSHIDEIPENSLDIITMWHVLEHVPDLSERMNTVMKLLKPNGTSFIALPNPNSFDALYYKEHWAAYDVPRHLYHFSKESFQLLVKNYDFEIIDIIPMSFDSFYISLMSERYRKSLIPYLKALFIGLRSNLYAKVHGKNYSSLIYVLKKK